MLSHKLGVFAMTGNIILMGDYPEEDYKNYFQHFMDFTFDFDGDIQSIGFRLEVPHKNRLATVFLFNRPSNEVIGLNHAGQKVDPMGIFQLKLSYDGRTDHWWL